jgi:phage recombination protein Bet
MSDTALVSRESFVPQRFNEEEVRLIKDQICRNATDSELKMFLRICEHTGLDPFRKQIYAVKRWDSNLGREVMSAQTGIDGFRSVAEGAGDYAGQLGPFWCGKDGAWVDVWLADYPPVASKVGVLRAGFKEPLWAVALYKSYVQRKKDGSVSKFWVQMPELMLAKVAEALAIRKAFPQKLSGLYTSDEMGQADNPEGLAASAPSRALPPAPAPIPEAEVVGEGEPQAAAATDGESMEAAPSPDSDPGPVSADDAFAFFDGNPPLAADPLTSFSDEWTAFLAEVGKARRALMPKGGKVPTIVKESEPGSGKYYMVSAALAGKVGWTPNQARLLMEAGEPATGIDKDVVVALRHGLTDLIREAEKPNYAKSQNRG